VISGLLLCLHDMCVICASLYLTTDIESCDSDMCLLVVAEEEDNERRYEERRVMQGMCH
jgi:hypothetical protein